MSIDPEREIRADEKASQSRDDVYRTALRQLASYYIR